MGRAYVYAPPIFFDLLIDRSGEYAENENGKCEEDHHQKCPAGTDASRNDKAEKGNQETEQRRNQRDQRIDTSHNKDAAAGIRHIRQRAETLATHDCGDLAVNGRFGFGNREAVNIRREVISVCRHVKTFIDKFGGDIEIPDGKNRVPVGTHQADECSAHLGVGRIFDIEYPVEYAVNREKHARLADKAVRDADVHQPHQIAAAANQDMPVRHAFDAATGKVFKIVDAYGRTLVFIHQSGESRGKAAF